MPQKVISSVHVGIYNSHQKFTFRAGFSQVREPAACLQDNSDVYKLAQMLVHHHKKHSKLV